MVAPVGRIEAAGLEQRIPLTPTICQVPEPVGVAPPVGPVTVAVKLKLVPSSVDEVLVFTLTVGANWETFKEASGVLGPAVR